MSAQSHSPPDSFTPRQEFRSSSSVNQRHLFALLTISSASSLRLYSFPTNVITSVRALLTSLNLIHSTREDPTQSMIEYSLHGKLWTQPKNASTEKLLVDILAVIYDADWSYISSIDYGREHDDRVAMAFRYSVASQLDKVIPFALSFPNSSLLRVVSPPLHLTPAVLAAVRGSWPRGVVGEKKVSEGIYEFKLKGYKWFQEDTFATDSLHHILTLLSSLDSHAFTLLTSLCLTNNRSRVKDLWIFTGPKSTESPNGSVNTLPSSQIMSSPVSMNHRRMASSPIPAKPSLPLTPMSSIGRHERAATTPKEQPVSSPPLSPGMLRKAAPRAQVPVSVVSRPEYVPERKPAPRAQVPVSIIDEMGDEPTPVRELPPFASPVRPEFFTGIRQNLPSEVPEGAENMTGVGSKQHTPDVFYTATPFPGPNNYHRPDSTEDSFYGGNVSHEDHEEEQITNLLHPNAFDPKTLSAGSHESPDSTPIDSYMDVHRGARREDESDTSVPIPVIWTGPGPAEHSPIDSRTSAGTPFFPGAWAPTPTEERPKHERSASSSNLSSAANRASMITEVHENTDRMAPQVIEQLSKARQSEAGMLVTLEDGEWKTSKSPAPIPPVSVLPHSPGSPGTPGVGGQGWVIVDVDGQLTPMLPEQANTSQAQPQAPVSAPATTTTDKKAVYPEQNPISPAAKAIAIADAVGSETSLKTVGSRDKDRPAPTRADSGSGVRRFLSLSSKKADDGPEDKDLKKSNSGFRSRLKRLGGRSS